MLDKEILVNCSLHILSSLFVMVTVGTGLTTTEAVNGAPGHEPKLEGPVGIIVYVTVVGVVFVEVNVCVIVEPLPATFPVIPETDAEVHAKVEPAILEVKAILVAVAEQIVLLAGFAAPVGAGLTVTVTFNGVLGQPFSIAVTVYTTFTAAVVPLFNVCAIVEPEPAVAFRPEAVHVKVAPEGVLVNATLVVSPVHIV